MTVLEEDLDFLAHYGVKGMKWGQRKASKISGSSNSGTKTSGRTLVKPPKEKLTPEEIQARRNKAKMVGGALLIGAGVAALVVAKQNGVTLGNLPKLPAGSQKAVQNVISQAGKTKANVVGVVSKSMKGAPSKTSAKSQSFSMLDRQMTFAKQMATPLDYAPVNLATNIAGKKPPSVSRIGGAIPMPAGPGKPKSAANRELLVKLAKAKKASQSSVSSGKITPAELNKIRLSAGNLATTAPKISAENLLMMYPK